MKRIFLIAIALLIGGCVLDPARIFQAARGSTVQPGDPVRGELIFREGVNDAPPCMTCHALVPGGFALGPNLHGIAERGATRVPGLDTSGYIRQSVLDPHAFVVPGFRDIMYPDYAQFLNDDDLRDLVAYLLTL